MTTTDEELINKKIRDKFKAIFQDESLIERDLEEFAPNNLFDIGSVKNAVKQINTGKALGRDYWSVKLLQNKGVEADLLCKDLADSINRGIIPEYCREARMCPFSKTGNPCVTVDDIRPISIQSHPRKVIELMIRQLLEESKSFFLESLDYQRGFKAGKSTHSNLAEILGVVTEDVSKRRNGLRSFLSVDLSKAYDKVKRHKMFEVLKIKAQTNVEKTVVQLLERLYHDQKMYVRDHVFPVNVGVAQGDILAPNLFAVYLDAALKGNAVLSRFIDQQKLYAYADDIVVITENQEEMEQAIVALESLEASWDLQLNKKKSQILSKDKVYGVINKDQDEREFKGVQVMLYMDYLGMRFYTTTAESLKHAEKKTQAKLMFMKGKFRSLNSTLNQAIISAYVRSIIRYQYVPLYAARLVTAAGIDKREGILIKKVLGIAMSTNQDVVKNTNGVHYHSLGSEVAYAGTRLRKLTIELYSRPSEELEHMKYEKLINDEDELKELDPEEFKRYQAHYAQEKKQFTQARAKVTLVPLSQRLMLQTAQNRLHPHGRYKVFDCVSCLVEEKDLPEHWMSCPQFIKELETRSRHDPQAFQARLREQNNNILSLPKKEQSDLIQHFDAIVETIRELEDSCQWLSRDHITTTAVLKPKPNDDARPLPAQNLGPDV